MFPADDALDSTEVPAFTCAWCGVLTEEDDCWPYCGDLCALNAHRESDDEEKAGR